MVQGIRAAKARVVILLLSRDNSDTFWQVAHAQNMLSPLHVYVSQNQGDDPEEVIDIIECVTQMSMTRLHRS